MDRYSESDNFELTQDMVQALFVYFEEFAEDGVLCIQKDHKGLWFVSSKRRAFLGLARFPRRKVRRLI
ncbi:MAG: hypothetical protein ACJA06_000370 [Halocynthiibacter sp.]|jgi:hypothetical protein